MSLDSSVLIASAVAAQKAGRFDEAIEIVRPIRAAEPEHADVNQLFGILASQTGDFEPRLGPFARLPRG
jgi:hypothetical protein